MRVILFCLIILVGTGLTPVAAQAEKSALDWIPADFEGFLRVDLTQPNQTLLELNIAYYVASYIQPLRVDAAQQRSLEDFFPVDFFDVEGASFEAAILPWLSGELIAAYREFDDRFTVSTDDLLLILPTEDSFAAAAALSQIVEAQDLAERDSYRGTPIVVGDQTSMAFTPGAVLIGPRELLKQALDAQAGEQKRLIETEAYMATAFDNESTVSAYIDGSAALRALSIALHGDSSAEQLLSALGNVLEANDAGMLETALLTGSIDGLSIALGADTFRRTVNASVRLQANTEQPAADPVTIDDTVLGLIPRSAMVVQSGSNAQTAFHNALLTLPLSGFVGDVLGGFVVNPQQAQTRSQQSPPTADDIQAAVTGFMAAVEAGRGFDIDEDLVAHLDGSYAFALIPRPNNPDPIMGARYDMLLITQTADASAALDGASQLAQTVFAVGDEAFEDTEIDDSTFKTLFIEPIHEPALQLGTVDGMLVVGTGSAVEQAMRAGRGDNRLVNVPRWQSISRNGLPTLYVDLNAIYNTFFAAQSGGAVSQGIGQLGMETQDLGGGLFRISVTVTLPEPV